MEKLLFTLLLSVCCQASVAQYSHAARDSIARLSNIDYEQMKKQLDISVPGRPGPSGNPQAPNAANRNEAKVNKYVLPDPLIMKNGKPVTTPELWWNNRRWDIIEDFDREVYGRLPKNIPSVTWKVLSEKDTASRLMNGALLFSQKVSRFDLACR